MKRTNGITYNPTKQFWDPLYQNTLVARACATQSGFLLAYVTSIP